jgi:GTP cyclohydrolase II
MATFNYNHLASAFKDLQGRRFGSLVVLRRIPNKPNRRETFYLLRCDCGNQATATRGQLVSKTRATKKTCTRNCITKQMA